MKPVKDLFQTFRDGDRLSTEELVFLRERMTILCNVAREFGPCMDMVVNFMAPRIESIEGYIKHREEKKSFTF
jgi:hypothetical protein